MQKYQHLFAEIKRIIRHEKEIERIKGHQFNVFSILKLETAENATHSAFLGELLNPKGSHLQGKLFLDLFLETISHENKQAFNSETAQLILEKHIGARDDEMKTGGRIDIYLEDNAKNSICIENKIHAIDQYAQIERYHKHKENNTVYYLNLDGKEPDKASKGLLQNGEDFYIISYDKEILEWLIKCQQVAVDQPILRETIKQYSILIQKLTGKMTTSSQAELDQLIFNNIEEAAVLAQNFERTIVEFTTKMRENISTALQIKLDQVFIEKYAALITSETSKKFSQIWITLKKYPKSPLVFAMESFGFNKQDNGSLYIGIFTNSVKSNFEINNPNKLNSYWLDHHKFGILDDLEIDFSNANLLKRLKIDTDFQIRFVNYIVEESINYIKNREEELWKNMDKIQLLS